MLRRNPVKAAVNFSEVRKQAKMYTVMLANSEVQLSSETQSKGA